MDFYIKQRIFSFRDQFTVFNGEKSPVYKVDGKFFSIGNQLAITTTEGTPVLQIKQQVMSFMPRYAILNEEKELCVVAKKMSFFELVIKLNHLIGRLKEVCLIIIMLSKMETTKLCRLRSNG